MVILKRWGTRPAAVAPCELAGLFCNYGDFVDPVTAVPSRLPVLILPTIRPYQSQPLTFPALPLALQQAGGILLLVDVFYGGDVVPPRHLHAHVDGDAPLWWRRGGRGGFVMLHITALSGVRWPPTTLKSSIYTAATCGGRGLTIAAEKPRMCTSDTLWHEQLRKAVATATLTRGA